MVEERMELFIETLTGTAFELSCSPLETIVSIKAKIQYSEGIPVSQQHLIWKSQELNDDFCLQDYKITDGATLKLVLGMRGGPINTRQISDSKKLKNIAEFVERRSETSGSSGRPFTVLVFHDGDKVHMYTLTERGDCAVSPVSGTISDSSSVASLKQVEELDQEIIRENEITKEKISQLQEQIRRLNINRSKRLSASSSITQENNALSKTSDSNNSFHLPPIQRIESLDHQIKQNTRRTNKRTVKRAEKDYFSRFAPDVGSKLNRPKLSEYESNSDFHNSEYSLKISQSVLDSVSNQITSPLRKGSDSESTSCSSFLPSIVPSPKTSLSTEPFKNLNTQHTQYSFNSDLNGPMLKCDMSNSKHLDNECPLTSNQALSTKSFIHLNQWLQNRPQTMPEISVTRTLFEEEPIYRNTIGKESRINYKMKRLKNPLSVSFTSGDKSSLTMNAFMSDSHISSPSVPCKNKSNLVHSNSKTDIGALITAGVKALKVYSPPPQEGQENSSKQNNTKSSPKAKDASSRPGSGRRLPLIKAKKKAYKRCSLCSKRTGLATSYTCRCGKNFCAPHRYAEVHHCSYDYKTEGRRILQLNNPVVAASKLPKI